MERTHSPQLPTQFMNSIIYNIPKEGRKETNIYWMSINAWHYISPLIQNFLFCSSQKPYTCNPNIQLRKQMFTQEKLWGWSTCVWIQSPHSFHCNACPGCLPIPISFPSDFIKRLILKQTEIKICNYLNNPMVFKKKK